MPLLLSEQRTDAWLDGRLDKITASVAAGCLGIHPYCSRQKAWRLITAREVEEWNGHLERGVDLEENARAGYESHSGLLVDATGLWVHPVLSWLLASPDGLVGQDGLVEIKCPFTLHKEVPLHYQVQMQVQLAVTDRRWCDFYSYVEWDGRVYDWCKRIMRCSKAEEAKILTDLGTFYQEFIVKDEPPPRKKRRKKGMPDDSACYLPSWG